MRRLESIVISENGGELRFELTGDGFLYNMVRIIVGTLIEVGAHSRAAEDMPAILASGTASAPDIPRPRRGFAVAGAVLTAARKNSGKTKSFS